MENISNCIACYVCKRNIAGLEKKELLVLAEKLLLLHDQIKIEELISVLSVSRCKFSKMVILKYFYEHNETC